MNVKKVKTKKVMSPEEILAAKKSLQIHETDVGSSGVQIANLTARILNITRHISNHRGDKHSRHGLVKLVSQRRRLLKHLKNSDQEKHASALAALGLRK